MIKRFCLACSCLLLLAACGAGTSESTFGKLARAVSASGETSLAGGIDSARALALLYGNCDARLKSAVWKARDVPAGEQFRSFREGGATRVSVLLGERVRDGGRDRFFLVTGMVPLEADGTVSGCLDCGQAVGGAVFTLRGDRWVLDGWTPFVVASGAVAHPPVAELVSTGLSRHGVMVTGSVVSQGVATRTATLLALSGRALAVQFQVRNRERAVAQCGDAGAGDRPRCLDRAVELSFRPGTAADRFDIHATPNDSDWEYAPGVKGVRSFRFDGREYVAVGN